MGRSLKGGLPGLMHLQIK